MSGQIAKLHRMFEAENQDSYTGNKIIAFTSGKGGTGKTFLSVNIAHCLAHRGYKILFIDFDSNLSNANVLLNINPQKTIIDYFLGKVLFENLITPGAGNIDYIFGDSGRLDYPKITVDQISRFLTQLHKASKNYDYIFIDTGAGINNEIIYLLGKMHKNIFVTTPEPTSIIDSYAVIKMLHSKSRAVKNSVIINTCENKQQADEAFENMRIALSHFLKISIDYLGFVQFDQSVRKSVIDQNLFVSTFPKSSITSQIISISEKLSGIEQLANIHHS